MYSLLSLIHDIYLVATNQVPSKEIHESEQEKEIREFRQSSPLQQILTFAHLKAKREPQNDVYSFLIEHSDTLQHAKNNVIRQIFNTQSQIYRSKRQFNEANELLNLKLFWESEGTIDHLQMKDDVITNIKERYGENQNEK